MADQTKEEKLVVRYNVIQSWPGLDEIHIPLLSFVNEQKAVMFFGEKLRQPYTNIGQIEYGGDSLVGDVERAINKITDSESGLAAKFSPNNSITRKESCEVFSPESGFIVTQDTGGVTVMNPLYTNYADHSKLHYELCREINLTNPSALSDRFQVAMEMLLLK